MLQAQFILFKINMYVWKDNFKQKLALKNIFRLLRSRGLKGEVSVLGIQTGTLVLVCFRSQLFKIYPKS